MKNYKLFKELIIDQRFDFVDDENPGYNSFFNPCIKISAWNYIDCFARVFRIGSINCKVFHVKEKEK
jgi:hypothetical protein